jgi:amino acid transporter
LLLPLLPLLLLLLLLPPCAGFDAVPTSAEEIKNPKRDLPLGILGAEVKNPKCSAKPSSQSQTLKPAAAAVAAAAAAAAAGALCRL